MVERPDLLSLPFLPERVNEPRYRRNDDEVGGQGAPSPTRNVDAPITTTEGTFFQVSVQDAVLC